MAVRPKTYDRPGHRGTDRTRETLRNQQNVREFMLEAASK